MLSKDRQHSQFRVSCNGVLIPLVDRGENIIILFADADDFLYFLSKEV
jgi:hypothetical protein